jgi:hypothetical protein
MSNIFGLHQSGSNVRRSLRRLYAIVWRLGGSTCRGASRGIACLINVVIFTAGMYRDGTYDDR